MTDKNTSQAPVVHSVFDDLMLYDKLKKESNWIPANKTVFEEMISFTVKVTEQMRQQGIYSVMQFYDACDNRFLKNVLMVFSPDFSGDLGRPVPSLYWLKPILLSESCRGIDFIRSIILLEGILMEMYGGFAPPYINYRLNAIIGNVILSGS